MLHETQFPPLEEKRTDEMEMAAQEDKESKTAKKNECSRFRLRPYTFFILLVFS